MIGKDNVSPFDPSGLLDLAAFGPCPTKYFWTPGKPMEFHLDNSEIGHTVAFGPIAKAMSIIDAE